MESEEKPRIYFVQDGDLVSSDEFGVPPTVAPGDRLVTLRAYMALRAEVERLRRQFHEAGEYRLVSSEEWSRIHSELAQLRKLAEWSFDHDAFVDHQGACLMALRVTNNATKVTRWEVFAGHVREDTGDLEDLDGNEIGWHADDVEAWKPLDATAPSAAALEAWETSR